MHKVTEACRGHDVRYIGTNEHGEDLLTCKTCDAPLHVYILALPLAWMLYSFEKLTGYDISNL